MPRDRRRQLLRHQRADVGLHDRLPGPEPGPRPVRRRGPAAGLRPGLHRAAGARRTTARRSGSPRPCCCWSPSCWARSRRSSSSLAPVIMPLFAPGFEGRDPRPHRHPLAGPLPDPDPARDQRRRRRHPQQLRPLRRLRDLAAVLEPDDHRRRSSCSTPLFHGQDRIYAYAIGILVGTLVQLLIPAWDLRNTPFRFNWSFDWRNPDVRRVLLLMLPVTISLGLINFNLLINSFFGSLVCDAGAGGDRQGVPHLPAAAGDLLGGDRDGALPDPGPLRRPRRDRRPAGDDGQRDAPDPLRPGAGGRRGPRPLRADDPARLPARRIRRPSRPTLVATALFWFAFSLPTNGLYLLQTRTFFSLQRPWMATGARRRRPRRLGPRARWPSTSPSASAASSPATGDRHHRRASSPRRWSCAASSAASSCGRLLVDRDPDHDRLRGAGRGRLRRLGRARQRARARPRRPDRLARRRPRRSAASSTSALARLLRIAELEQIMRLLRARARCSAPGATCWASLELGAARRLRLARGDRACAGGCCPSSTAPRRIWRPRCSRSRCCSGSPSCSGPSAVRAGAVSRCVVVGVCSGLWDGWGAPPAGGAWAQGRRATRLWRRQDPLRRTGPAAVPRPADSGRPG